MAGSYNHVVMANEDSGKLPIGSLIEPEDICGMLECMSGDVVECVEEMYGMIWYLADRLNVLLPHPSHDGKDLLRLIDDARRNYRIGLEKSPTPRYQKEDS